MVINEPLNNFSLVVICSSHDSNKNSVSKIKNQSSFERKNLAQCLLEPSVVLSNSRFLRMPQIQNIDRIKFYKFTVTESKQYFCGYLLPPSSP